MRGSSQLLRLAALVSAALLARTASAQTTANTSGGGVGSGDFSTVAFTTGYTQFANLSLWDCQHSSPMDFQYAYTWISGQEVGFLLSTDSTCSTVPSGAWSSVTGTTSCTANADGCPAMTLLGISTRGTDPSDGMTTDWDSMAPQYTLNTGGFWDFYQEQAVSTAANDNDTYGPNEESNTTTCPTGVDTLAYICVWATEATSASTWQYGALSVALNSTAPTAPGAPTVTPLDSGLNVSWPAVSSAYYYNVYVIEGGSVDGGTSSGDAGPTIAVTNKQVSNQTTIQIFGLSNGVQYGVYVVALDDSGSQPPTSSNVSEPSPIAYGTPIPSYSFFDEYKAGGGTENGGCSNTAAPAIAGLVALLVLLRRRRQRRLPHAAALLTVLVALGGSRLARADDDESVPSDSSGDSDVTKEDFPKDEDQEPAPAMPPVERKPSPEYVRIEASAGVFTPDPGPSAGIPGNPYAAIFPKGNQVIYQLRIHANMYQGFGKLSIGVGLGLWNAYGHSLLASGSPAGDNETFAIYPLSLLLGYRLDFIYEQWKVPLVPFVEGGYSIVPWQDLKNGKISSGVDANGERWVSEGVAGGPVWIVGLEFPLEFLDQQRAVNLDEDFGINSIGIYGDFGWGYWKGFDGGINLGGWMGSGGLYLAF